MRRAKDIQKRAREPDTIKKSFNLNPDLAQSVDDFIRENPGVSFTLVMNQALKTWLQNPKIEVKRSKVTAQQVEEFMEINADLLDDLSR